jgi:plastocyanin domain-containing protein
MNKNALLIIFLGFIIGLGIIFIGNLRWGNDVNNKKEENTNNIEIKDGVQYITINVKGGYFPKISNAKSGIPTKLIMKTNGYYDCSLSLVIKSIGYRKVLPTKGEEIIDIGTPLPGAPFLGVCSMGMYSFSVNFN